MFILEYSVPVAMNVGKIDYNMVYRWKQIAMCTDKAPLLDFIKRQKPQYRDNYRIEEYPDD